MDPILLFVFFPGPATCSKDRWFMVDIYTYVYASRVVDTQHLKCPWSAEKSQSQVVVRGTSGISSRYGDNRIHISYMVHRYFEVALLFVRARGIDYIDMYVKMRPAVVGSLMCML